MSWPLRSLRHSRTPAGLIHSPFYFYPHTPLSLLSPPLPLSLLPHLIQDDNFFPQPDRTRNQRFIDFWLQELAKQGPNNESRFLLPSPWTGKFPYLLVICQEACSILAYCVTGIKLGVSGRDVHLCAVRVHHHSVRYYGNRVWT
eukprot:872571-Amorphochlora_amoeboformis.AAC.1